MLLKRTTALLNSVLRGLDGFDLETRKKVMESCGVACARSDGDLGIAERIATETQDEAQLLRIANDEIPWCGTWIRDGDRIKATCVECGCPLVRNGVVPLSGTLCYCSRGWVKAIFETLLRRLVRVELEESIGLGGKVCSFVVLNAGDN